MCALKNGHPYLINTYIASRNHHFVAESTGPPFSVFLQRTTYGPRRHKALSPLVFLSNCNFVSFRRKVSSLTKASVFSGSSREDKMFSFHSWELKPLSQ